MEVRIRFWNDKLKKFEERQYFCVDEVHVNKRDKRQGLVEVNGMEMRV